jgi:hypothetical protein
MKKDQQEIQRIGYAMRHEASRMTRPSGGGLRKQNRQR